MNESSDHDDAQMEHPDPDDAIAVDDHGPMFPATFEGLSGDDDWLVADD
jgi:hypothetical protein